MGRIDDYRRYIGEVFVDEGADGLHALAEDFGDRRALLVGGDVKRVRHVTDDDRLLDPWLLDLRREVEKALAALDRGDLRYLLTLFDEGDDGRA